ncbi:thiol-disulfide oxidoreductase [Azospirillum sp. RWY-5-1]|nr:thiol-disulfide oxidoreductase [Azospirillum oleiclasticum]
MSMTSGLRRGGGLAGAIRSRLWPPETATHARVHDGLTVFAPMWAVAMLFSLADNPSTFIGRDGPALFLVGWTAVLAAVALVIRPRLTWLLGLLAAALILRYALLAPVASNNKTITLFMNTGILLVLAQAAWSQAEPRRELVYQHLRVIARGLLAVMYFYGIFHKINTDFLDPNVSCAVMLYAPLARPFGLDGNLFGRYLAIYSTFIIEAIAIAALYWRRWFAVGLILALVFHYIIPISAYSWYMDFSCLVFALYALTMPPEAQRDFYRSVAGPLRRVRGWFGNAALPLAGGLLVAAAWVSAMIVATDYPERPLRMFYHSTFIMVWAMFGAVASVLMTRAALEHLPYRGAAQPRQPLWLHLIPLALFVACTSPYIGLKTESSINMFSNLHTEGGETNHLLFARPPYLFGYKDDVVEILDSSHPYLLHLKARNERMVLYALKDVLRRYREHWVTYRLNGLVEEEVTHASFPAFEQPSLLERAFLIFKTVDVRRPKVCTH